MRCGFVAFEDSIMRFSRNVIIGAARFMSNGTTATDGKGILKVLATVSVGSDRLGRQRWPMRLNR